MSGPQRSPRAAAALVLGVTAALGLVLSALHLPSAVLFASLVGGMAHALTSMTALRVPPTAAMGAVILVLTPALARRLRARPGRPPRGRGADSATPG